MSGYRSGRIRLLRNYYSGKDMFLQISRPDYDAPFSAHRLVRAICQFANSLTGINPQAIHRLVKRIFKPPSG